MTSRSAWFIPIVLALIVGATGWWAETTVRRTLRQKMGEELRSASRADITALEIWISNQKRLAYAIAQDPHIQTHSQALLTGETGVLSAQANGSSDLDREFTGYLRDRLRSVQFEVGQLISTNFIIVADTGRGRMHGEKVLDDLVVKYSEVFETGEPVLITPFNPFKKGRFSRRPPTTPRYPDEWRERMQSRFDSPGVDENNSIEKGEPLRPPVDVEVSPNRGRNQRTGGGAPRFFNFRDFSIMQVAVPVKDEEGKVIGALAVMIQPEAEFTRILSVARIGDSGETIAFDQNGLLLSRSRFEDELKKSGLIEDREEAKSSLNLYLKDPGTHLTNAGLLTSDKAEWPLMDLVLMAHTSQLDTGMLLDPTRDYRGVPVVGVYRWLHDHGFGVITKIDADEAFELLTMVRMIFLVLFLLLILFALILLISSYLNLVWRRRLTQAESKIKELGQYRLEEKIGEGGMGVVYRATHALLRRQTAVKLLLAEKTDAESIQRFESEVRTTCQLNHPNTIQVYDYGRTSEGSFYYAMEYLEGTNLRDLVHRYGAQPDGRVLHVLSHVCASLEEAHGAGLIHRDIKPANIFLCVRGGVPDNVKVLDFGLVKQASVSEPLPLKISHSKSITGTPQYLAPEAIKTPETADHRSDIYAVGAVGYFLLTGSHVFEGDNIMEVFQKQLSDEPLPPSQRTGRPMSSKFEEILMSCLQKNPEARPQSMSELYALFQSCEPCEEWGMEVRKEWWKHFQAEKKGTIYEGQKNQPSSVDKTLIIERAGI